MARMLAPMGFALALLTGCPSTTETTQSCGREGDDPCPAGFNCTENVCKESLSCDLRTRGAPNPVRIKANVRAKGEDCKNTTECAEGTYCDKFADVCTDTLASGAKCGSSDACPQGEYCKDGTCSKAGCAADQFCRETAESADCVTAGCRSSAECSGAQKCIESECKVPPDTAPDACIITNQGRTFAQNAVVEIKAVATAGGVVIPFKDYTVTSSNTSVFTVEGKSIRATGTAAGESSITVTFGSFACPTGATFFHAGDFPDATYSRVVLLEVGDNGEPAPIENFTADNFRFASSTGASTLADAVAFQHRNGGVYYVKPAAGFVGPAESLNVVGSSYNPYSVIFAPLDRADIILPLERFGTTAGFGGAPSFSAFDTEFPALEDATIAIAYGGGSFPLVSLLNFNLDLFIGDTAPKAIDANILTSGSSGSCAIVGNDKVAAEGEFPLPRALYAQLGSGKLGVNCDGYATRAVPGPRKVWSLGAKLRNADVLSAVQLVTGSSGISLASALPIVLPLLDNFAIGNESLPSTSILPRKAASQWDTFKAKTPGDMMSDSSFPFVTLSPARRLKFTTNFDNPGIIQDTFPGSTATDKMNAFVTLVTAISNAYGIVPLGFGAGLDADGNGQLESLSPEDTTRFPANKIHTRNASPSADIAEADIVAVTVAINFDDLALDEPKSPAIRLKGLVARDKGTGIGWNTTSPSVGSFDDAVKSLNFATTATYALGAEAGGNTLIMPQFGVTATGAEPNLVVVRVSRTGAKRYWNVVINPAKAIAGPAIALSTNGFDSGTDDVVCASCTGKNMSVTATTLDVKNVDANFNTRVGPLGGKDLDGLAGETKSFSLYIQEIGRAP